MTDFILFCALKFLPRTLNTTLSQFKSKLSSFNNIDSLVCSYCHNINSNGFNQELISQTYLQVSLEGGEEIEIRGLLRNGKVKPATMTVYNLKLVT